MQIKIITHRILHRINTGFVKVFQPLFLSEKAGMLPLSLLKTAVNHPMLVELKNGETYNGHLVNCDNWMNLQLRVRNFLEIMEN